MPRTYCVVYGCLNSASAKPELSYFKLPTDFDRRSKWLRLIAREDLMNKPPQNYTVCEDHFNAVDILTGKHRKKLKTNSLPSLHLPDIQKRDVETLTEAPNLDEICTQTEENSDDSMPAADKREFKVFCPKCKTKVLHNVEGMQKDETWKIIIANVYHYFEQEYDQLTKTYEGVDLNPLSKFSERTALATGVSESTVLEILQERARRNADVPQKPVRKRPRQSESSTEEDISGGDEDDGEHSTTEHVVETLVVKEEPETYNDEPEVYVELACVKTEPDACGDDRELADPISVHVKTEPQDERDTTCSETVAVQSAAKRHKGSIKPRHAEAPPASCAAPSGQLPLPPDQQLKVENPLTNQQGFS